MWQQSTNSGDNVNRVAVKKKKEIHMFLTLYVCDRAKHVCECSTLPLHDLTRDSGMTKRQIKIYDDTGIGKMICEIMGSK